MDGGAVVVWFNRVFTKIGNVLISFSGLLLNAHYSGPKTLLWFWSADSPYEKKKQQYNRIYSSKECAATGQAKTKGAFYFEMFFFSLSLFLEIFSFFT